MITELLSSFSEGEAAALAGQAAVRLGDWYRDNARRLPWREKEPAESYPYRVWVSEIMLQQTRVEAVIPYYRRFLAAFPDIPSLAAAEDDKLRKLWEGLGYYSRARNLKKGAAYLMERGGRLPADIDGLRQVPGIGAYTAGAVGSIAFGLPEPAVDGNFLRVFSRLLAAEGDIARPAVKAAFRELLRAAYASLPEGLPAGDVNQAVMDLGAGVCLPKNPRCADCPIRKLCAAAQREQAPLFPVKGEKKPRRVEEKTVLVIVRAGEVLLRQRPEQGLLGGLWEFPNLDGKLPAPEAAAWLEGQGLTPEGLVPLPPAKHLFTHIEWRMTGFLTLCSGPVPPGWQAADRTALRERYPLPSAFRAYRKAAEKEINDEPV